MENRKRHAKMYWALALGILLAVTAFTACSPNKDNVQKDAGTPAVIEKSPSQFAGLVKKGTLTQEQADAVDVAIKSAVDQGKLPHLALGPLEDAGTITAEEEQAILAVLKLNPPPGASPVTPIAAPAVAPAQ